LLALTALGIRLAFWHIKALAPTTGCLTLSVIYIHPYHHISGMNMELDDDQAAALIKEPSRYRRE
jgi:hypothetical protein